MTATTITSATTGTDSFLRFAMRLDAVLTGLMGIAGAALAPRIAEMSGTTTAFEYGMAAFFIGYGALVLGLARMKHVRIPGIWVICGNVLYTVASVIFVLAGVFPLTTTGVVATLGAGVYTLVMADLQYMGVRRMRA